MVSYGVPENTLWQAKSKSYASWSFIDDLSDKRKVLIQYEKLSPSNKDKVKARFGNPYNFVVAQPIKDMVLE